MSPALGVRTKIYLWSLIRSVFKQCRGAGQIKADSLANHQAKHWSPHSLSTRIWQLNPLLSQCISIAGDVLNQNRLRTSSTALYSYKKNNDISLSWHSSDFYNPVLARMDNVGKHSDVTCRQLGAGGGERGQSIEEFMVWGVCSPDGWSEKSPGTMRIQSITIRLLSICTIYHLLSLHETAIFQKDLLSTLYLLIAIAKHFQPDLPVPSNINVEVVIIERTSKGLRSENAVECITESRENLEDQSQTDAFDELFTHAPDKLDDVKKALLQFVNKHVGKLGLNVTDAESQFADGVFLLLLIGQLEGYFLNLREFFLNPSSAMEMLHNVNLAVALLTDGGVLDFPVNAEDIVNRDMKTTLKVLYCLYSKYKTREM
ncbi:gamma-parvin-like isoform X1 [Carettochelys insculpta]|uniref:gamma-parvin-like isoform X1 n=1 Tax=Carettochelys insculpta TaxID=44489 RepID=UPI003EBB2779